MSRFFFFTFPMFFRDCEWYAAPQFGHRPPRSFVTSEPQTVHGYESLLNSPMIRVARFTGGTRRMPRPLRSGRKPTLYDTNHVTSKAKAERALYDRLRDETDLTANLVQKGIRRAVEAVKSGVGRLKRGENTSQPHFSADSAVYDKRSATFHRTTFLFRP